MERKPYVSVPQAAKILRKSRIAIFKQVKSGKVEAVRIGKNYMITKTSLKRMILNRTIKDIERDINHAVKKPSGNLKTC